jgi:antitoxin component YwqK of YwqJK toxin-antitoxin module
MKVLVAVLLATTVATNDGELLRENKYPSGAIESRGYVKLDESGAEIKVGKWESWYEGGAKQGEVTYKDGKADGVLTNWHENGARKSVVTLQSRKGRGGAHHLVRERDEERRGYL